MTAAQLKQLRDVRLALEELWKSARDENPVFGTATSKAVEDIIDGVVALIAREERRPLDAPLEPEEGEGQR